ncbi:MAG: type III pantothenate kinase [Acidobacteriota bacterium]
MLLAIDLGNTNIVLGVFDGARLVDTWRLATMRERTADELALLVDLLLARGGSETSGTAGVGTAMGGRAKTGIAKGAIDAIVLASVVPPLTASIEEMARRSFGLTALTVEPGVNAGMPILCEHPREVGADRVVNAVAAYEQWGRQAGRPIIIVDLGTATTLDAVSVAGAYLGGAICPGVQMSADALFQRAARLPRVAVRKPARVIGRTTVDAMESGLFFGYVGMVESLIRRMRDELGGDALCVATGGLAGAIAGETRLIDRVEPDLTLQGLRMVWERNQA